MIGPSILEQPSNSLLLQSTKLIILQGKPIPMPRPRFGGGRAYIPKETQNAKTLAGWEAMKQWGLPKIPPEVPVSISVEYTYRALRKKDVGAFRVKKPDVDNLLKFTCDLLIGLILTDDSQVVDIRGIKRWGPRDETKIFIQCGA